MKSTRFKKKAAKHIEILSELFKTLPSQVVDGYSARHKLLNRLDAVKCGIDNIVESNFWIYNQVTQSYEEGK